MTTKTVKQAEVAQLKLPNRKPVDVDRHYAQGFKRACELRRIEPLQVLDIANTLDLHL